MRNDLSHCNGIGCTLKDHCKRNEYFRKAGNMGIKRYGENTSFFTKPPFRIKKGLFECKFFWGNAHESLFKLLRNILFDTKKKSGNTLKKLRLTTT